MNLLCAIDMQNDFITGVFGTPEAEKIIPNVTKKNKEYLENVDKVLFTRDTHETEGTVEMQRLPHHCIFVVYTKRNRPYIQL